MRAMVRGAILLLVLLSLTIVVAIVPALATGEAQGGNTHARRFMQEYPVTWTRDGLHPTGGAAAPSSSFTPLWTHPSSSFRMEAYPPLWTHDKLHPTGSGDDVASALDRHELHVEPGMLFPRKSLYPGAILPEGTKLGGDGSPAPPRFVFKANAEAIPFSYNQRDTILKILGIAPGSQKASQVAYTLQICQEYSPPEPHTCATSQQAALDFVADALGTRDMRAMVTSVHGEEAAAGAARYVVAPKGITNAGTNKDVAVVPCHPMPYPYMVYFCHRPKDVQVLRVELMRGSTDGAAATAVVMCHSDTRNWDARFFDMLNVTRGEEICHFMPHNYITWMRAADAI